VKQDKAEAPPRDKRSPNGNSKGASQMKSPLNKYCVYASALLLLELSGAIREASAQIREVRLPPPS
jgi:hypothetical protein